MSLCRLQALRPDSDCLPNGTGRKGPPRSLHSLPPSCPVQGARQYVASVDHRRATSKHLFCWQNTVADPGAERGDYPLPISWPSEEKLWELLSSWLKCLQRVSIACCAERCINYNKSARPSVRPSVWHTLALCQYGSCYDRGVFTGG